MRQSNWIMKPQSSGWKFQKYVKPQPRSLAKGSWNKSLNSIFPNNKYESKKIPKSFKVTVAIETWVCRQGTEKCSFSGLSNKTWRRYLLLSCLEAWNTQTELSRGGTEDMNQNQQKYQRYLKWKQRKDVKKGLQLIPKDPDVS